MKAMFAYACRLEMVNRQPQFDFLSRLESFKEISNIPSIARLSTFVIWLQQCQIHI